ncbi:hypothetical protein [Paenibacillus sp. FSL W8-0194]|uniref:hypothetical protein n=1 Tax=Paenibacillus sp. FSL W8-0194 TaxID=2921711 RepID=UPI0030DA8D0B
MFDDAAHFNGAIIVLLTPVNSATLSRLSFFARGCPLISGNDQMNFFCHRNTRSSRDIYIMVMYLAKKYGFRHTLKFCLGVRAGFYVILLLCCYFNLWLKDIVSKIEFWMSIIGSAYMVYLGIKIIRSKEEGGRGNVEGDFVA